MHFGDLIVRLIWRDGFFPINLGETIGDMIDHGAAYQAPFYLAAFFSGALNFWIEDWQLRQRGGMLGFSIKTILTSLLAGVPAGILFLLTNKDRYDVTMVTIDSIMILALGVYYFWDAKERKQLKTK